MTSEQLDDYYTKMMKLKPTNFKVSDLPMQFSNQSTILTKDKKKQISRGARGYDVPNRKR